MTTDPTEVHAWDPDEAAVRARRSRGREEPREAAPGRRRLWMGLLVGLLAGMALEAWLGLLRGLAGG